jgi:hypothetical protein
LLYLIHRRRLTRITNGGNVLDDNNVVRVLALLEDLTSGALLGEIGSSLVKDSIGSDHVVDLNN